MFETSFMALLFGVIVEVINVLALFYFLHTTGRYVTDGDGKYIWKNVGLYVGVYAASGLITTHLFSLPLAGSRININDAVALLSGLIGGPITGTAVGLTIGIDRFMLDGFGAVPRSVTPIVSGILGGIIWMISKKKFPKISVAVGAIIVCMALHITLALSLQTFMNISNEDMYSILFALFYYNFAAMLIFALVYVYKILPLPMSNRRREPGSGDK